VDIGVFLRAVCAIFRANTGLFALVVGIVLFGHGARFVDVGGSLVVTQCGVHVILGSLGGYRGLLVDVGSFGGYRGLLLDLMDS